MEAEEEPRSVRSTRQKISKRKCVVDSDSDDVSSLPATPTRSTSPPAHARSAKKPRVTAPPSTTDDEEDEGAVSSSSSASRFSQFRRPAPTTKKRSKKVQDDDDDDFIVHDSESDEDAKSTASRSRSVSSRASSMNDDEDEDEDEDDLDDPPSKKSSSSKSKKKAPAASARKSEATPANTVGGDHEFLTAAERRLQTKKADKKATENPYDFLNEVLDKDRNAPGDPKYDPRTLYVPKKAWGTFTPFEKQFWEIKQNHYDTVLFFQKGKFYELYEEDARIGHREFDLKLTSRVKMSMVGVPEMSFNYWAAKFLGKGYKVGRVDQAETALGMDMRLSKSTKKSTEDKIVRRELNKVFTNGTLVDPELITDEQAGHCVCIRENADECEDKSTFGICVLDCSTSQFDLSAFEDDICRTKLETMMRQLRPKEIVYRKESLSVSTTRLLRAVLPASCIWTGLRSVEGLGYDETIQELNKVYAGEGEDGTEAMHEDDSLLSSTVPECIATMQHQRGAIEALGCMMWYLRQLNIDKDILGMKNFNIYDPMKRGQGLTLDGQSLAHLEILLNNEGTEEGTLLRLLSRCTTPSGKRLFRLWLCMPLRDVADINARLDAVENLMYHSSFEKDFNEISKALPDLERVVARIHANSCKVRDFLRVLAAFRKLSKGMRKLADESESFSSKTVLALLRSAPDLTQHLNNIEALYEPPKEKDGDELLPREGKDEDYDDVMSKIRDLEGTLDKELKKMEMKTGVKMTYWHSHIGTKDIYLIETKSSEKGLPKNWTKSSSTKAFNRWLVPELQSTIRTLKEERENRNAAMKAFKTRVFKEFDEDRGVWLRAVRIFSELDCLFSLAKSSAALEQPTCRPEFVDDTEAWVDFEELRHPALEHTVVSTGHTFIPNNVKLGKDVGKIALLTGPNMAGKSTVMRMTAVGVIMAQLGMLVPASKARLSPVDTILTRMGAYDNMFSNASTFKVELDECCKVLRDATPRSLVILDELGRGTSTFDGMAIAAAVLHQLSTHTLPLSFFATHYGSLADDFGYHPNIRNMHMSTVVDETKQELVFLYRLINGSATGSFGTHVAKLAGVPQDVVERAGVVSETFASHFKERMATKKQLSASSRLSIMGQADFVYLHKLAAGQGLASGTDLGRSLSLMRKLAQSYMSRTPAAQDV